MADPNILDLSEMTPKQASGALTTTLTTQLLDGVLNKALRIHLIQVSNIDGTNDADVTIEYHDGTNSRAFASAVRVPAKASLVILGNGSLFNLDESGEIRGGASANGDLEYIISYDELDDA